MVLLKLFPKNTVCSPQQPQPLPGYPAEEKSSTDLHTDATTVAAEGSTDPRGESTPARAKESLWSSSARSLAPAPHPSTCRTQNISPL